jgi:hypothetical protein
LINSTKVYIISIFYKYIVSIILPFTVEWVEWVEWVEKVEKVERLKS